MYITLMPLSHQLLHVEAQQMLLIQHHMLAQELLVVYARNIHLKVMQVTLNAHVSKVLWQLVPSLQLVAHVLRPAIMQDLFQVFWWLAVRQIQP